MKTGLARDGQTLCVSLYVCVLLVYKYVLCTCTVCSGRTLGDGVVGKAPIMTICTWQYSGGVNLVSASHCSLNCLIFTTPRLTDIWFLARDSIYAIARYMPSPVRLSVCPSVCLSVPLSVTRVDQSKTVEVRITQPSPQSSPMTLVS